MAPSGNGSGAAGTGSPCGACKFLRRKCAADCIFAPYFCSEQGPAQFAAIHKVFGASNVSKLLLHVPAPDRYEAVVTIAYEAQARIKDPVYGCVAHIFALQQQVAYLQAQLMQVNAQVAQNLVMDARRTLDQPWTSGHNHVLGSSNPSAALPSYHTANYINSSSNISPQSSIDSVDQSIDALGMQEIQSRPDHRLHHQHEFCNSFHLQQFSKKRPPNCDLGELQALALRMMRN